MNNVCHFTSVHKTIEDTRIFRKECISLAEAGYHVKLIAVNCNTEICEGVEIIGVKCNYKSRFQRMIIATKAVYRMAIKVDADVYHFHDPELLPYGLKLMKRGKIVIYDAHEDVPRQILSKYWLPKPIRKLFSVLFEIYENNVASKMSSVISATDFINERYLKNNPNSISVNNYPKLEELPNPIKFDEKKNEILYLGGITKDRGILEMVKSLSLVDTTLNLCGKFERESLRNEAISLPGWEKVNELGYITGNKINEMLNRSKAGLILLKPIINYLDAMPLKMFEYMAAGIPVIASDFPLWKQLVNDNNCGICVNPDDINGIAEAINFIINNDQKATEMGLNGRKVVEDKYNWNSEKRKLLQLYSDVSNKGISTT